MPSPMDSLTFLERPPRGKPAAIYVLHGDEDFLKRQTLGVLRRLVLGEDEQSFGLSMYGGDKAAFAAVRDELETLPFLAPRRLVVIEDADSFVSRNRAALEKYTAAPVAAATLVLLVNAWPSNTRLYKLIDSSATIACKAPPAYKLPAWCVHWASSCHGKQLTAQAAELLVELIGPEMGQLDRELEKLAVYVGEHKRIDEADVDKLVGRSRGENLWKIFEAIGAGRPREALGILGRLLEEGEAPLRILGAFSMQLRRLSQVARLARQGVPLDAAMAEAGVAPFARQGAEQQLRHLGRQRVDQLYEWLLQADLDLKGSSQLPERTILERLVIRLALPQR